jgi:penicillin-binding protein A
MSHQLQRLSLFFLLAFAVVAAAAGYWTIGQQDTLLARGDNPRRILLERRNPRGIIYDRHNAVLAESTGVPGALVRHYPYPQLAPVLGYVSPLYGSAGIEASQDAVLHGNAGYREDELFWQGAMLGDPPAGRAVRLTIDLGLQILADQALASQTGAIVLLDARSGEILAMASHPNYDANRLEADWPQLVVDVNAPLLNRATLALYQPGGAIWPVVVAAALEAGHGSLRQNFALAAQPVQVNGQTVGCRTLPGMELVTLEQAIEFRCPGPIATVGARLGPQALARTFRDFRLYDVFTIGLASAASAPADAVGDARLAALGQDSLTVTPLQMALVTAAISRGGQMPAPQLVLATEARGGAWRPEVPSTHPTATIIPRFAGQIRTLFQDGYTATALTGVEGQQLAWFLGFSSPQDAPFAVAVVLEDGDLAAAAAIGQQLLDAAAGGR